MSERVHPVRLAIWSALVAFFSYSAFANFASTGSASDTKNALFKWSTTGAIVANALLLIAIALAIAVRKPELRAFRRPRISFPAAFGLGFLAVAATYAATVMVAVLGGNPGREQGLLSDHWQPGRTAPFIANAVALGVLPAVSEELFARGVGFGLFRPLGRSIAIVAPALGWALMHGFPSGIFPLFVLGVGLGYLRERSDSIVPAMIVHGLFNGLALALAFTG